MSIHDIRKNIDQYDSKIVKLLNDRMEQVLMTKKFKPEVEDLEREQALFAKIKTNATKLISNEFIERLYLEIIKESKNLQAKNYKLIAFQGEHGAYSEVASRKWNDDFIPVPCTEFAQIFEGVKSELYDFGIVPVENTLGGIVGEANVLLINTDLHVVGAIEIPIHLCLLVLPGSDHREIRSAYSHLQALTQSRHFLARNRLDPVPYYDTAGAARMLAENRLKGSAAIASRLAAKLYNLEIIKEDIEDLDRNMTRFLILSKEAHRGEGDKCSVIFSTEHKAAALFKALEVFAKAEINLTRIESVPSEPGSYAFFLDFMGSIQDEKVTRALSEVQAITINFRLMGCYKERKVV